MTLRKALAVAGIGLLVVMGGCHTREPRTLAAKMPLYVYSGPALENVAVLAVGGGEIGDKLASQMALDLRAEGIRAANIAPLVRIASDEADLSLRLEDNGYKHVVVLVTTAGREESLAGVATFGSAKAFGNSVSGSSFSFPIVNSANTLAVDAQVFTVHAQRLWGNNFELYSRVLVGRDAKLIRNMSARIIKFLKRDGLIDSKGQ